MTGTARDDHPTTELIESLRKNPFITPVPIPCRSAEPSEQKVSSEPLTVDLTGELKKYMGLE